MGIIDGILEGLEKAVGWIGDAIGNTLSEFFGKLMYYVVSALCGLLKMVYSFFAVFAGLDRVTYDGSREYLINIFFGNHSVRNVYWGMAAIGILFLIVMTLIAVLKKTFDASGKQQQSHGAILLAGFKGLLAIMLLTGVMTAVINLTNLLVDRISYIFDHAETLTDEDSMTFTDEQFATMARVYNTIGNYSLNASYNSRYNLNSCYNEIRRDLLLLQEDGVFTFWYEEGEDGPTWQSELQKLMRASDPRYDLYMDDKTEVTAVILEIMETLRTDPEFFPVRSVERADYATDETVSLDRIVFLMGTLGAAKNDEFNKDPSVTDSLRGPFYYGKQSIYSYGEVSKAFDCSMSGISYILIILMAWFTMKNLVVCIFNCISRIFSLLGLYIIAPPVFATYPLDNGEKFKQWMTSAVVQTFGIFGCVIPMRLVILFIPMVLDSKLKVFSDPIMDLLARALLIIGAVEACNRFSGIVTGILANNAGFAAVQAGDMKDFAGRTFGKVTGAVTGAAGFAGKAALKTAGLAADVTGVGALGRWAGGKMADAGKYIADKGGIIVGAARGIRALHRGTTEGQLNERKAKVERAQLRESEKRYGLYGNPKPEEQQNRDIPPEAQNHGQNNNNNN